MELTLNNSKKLSIETSITHSLSLQHHLQILSQSIQEIEQDAFGLLEKNPALDDIRCHQHISNAAALDFIKQTSKENPFEQIPTKLLSAHDKILAEEILQSVCKEGFLQQEEKKFLIDKYGQKFDFVLEIVQNFTHIGFESRLLYWKCLLKKKGHFQKVIDIIDQFYDDMLKGNFLPIIKSLKISKEEFKKDYLDVFKTLPLNPMQNMNSSPVNQRIDAVITLRDSTYDICVSSLGLEFSINPLVYSENSDVKRFYKPHLDQLQSFLSGIQKRKMTFLKVLHKLTLIQNSYFEGTEAFPKPINPKTLASELNIHPSTIARCLQNKLLLTPRGLIELKTLVTPSCLNQGKFELLEKLKGLVKEENKKTPYTDDMLLKLLREKGAHLSRRTIVKYRKELNIPDARTRSFFN
jgi:RNA polymerase sigma-54 factor